MSLFIVSGWFKEVFDQIGKWRSKTLVILSVLSCTHSCFWTKLVIKWEDMFKSVFDCGWLCEATYSHVLIRRRLFTHALGQYCSSNECCKQMHALFFIYNSRICSDQARWQIVVMPLTLIWRMPNMTPRIIRPSLRLPLGVLSDSLASTNCQAWIWLHQDFVVCLHLFCAQCWEE